MTVVRDFTGILHEQGFSWAGNGTVGRPVFVTYSFEEAVPGYVADYDGAAFAGSFRPLEDDHMAKARTALAQWEDVSGLVFIEVEPGRGDIRFGLYDFNKHGFFAGSAGAAYYPSLSIGAASTARSEIGGDIYIDWRYASDLGLYQHELGHALGLKHPFEGDPQLAGDLDHKAHTALSYTGPAQPDIGPLDKDAIQYLYGKQDGAHLESWAWDAAAQTLKQIDGDDGDLLLGVGVADEIFGAGGRDTIAGFRGADDLQGGAAKDRLFGAEANDRLDGGSGADRLYGDGGKDVLLGAVGSDQGFGGDGKDQLFGGLHNDSLWGDAGDDLLKGASGLDWLDGGSGDDRIFGGGGGDLIFGGDGDDLLEGVKGDDALDGGEGSDALYGGEDADLLDGGRGGDFLDGGKAGDLLEGERGDDVLIGAGGSDHAFGGLGKDSLEGGSGKDSLDGGDGGDRLDGGAQDDWLTDGRGQDRLAGGEGDDVFQIVTDGREDVIEDFEAGQDRIAFSGLAFDDLTFVDVAPGEVRVEHAGEILTVEDGGEGRLSASRLSAGDFLFLY